MQKTSDEIKKAMLHCSPVSCRSNDCPYRDDTPKYEGDMPVCRMKLWNDMGRLIQQLEKDNDRLTDEVCNAYNIQNEQLARIKQLEGIVSEKEKVVVELSGEIGQLEAERNQLLEKIEMLEATSEE